MFSLFDIIFIVLCSLLAGGLLTIIFQRLVAQKRIKQAETTANQNRIKDAILQMEHHRKGFPLTAHRILFVLKVNEELKSVPEGTLLMSADEESGFRNFLESDN